MKRMIWACIILSLFSLNARSTTLLSEISYPKMIGVDGHHLYVSDQYSIFVYSLKDFKLLQRLGRHGKGPEEYDLKPSIQVTESGLLTSIPRKICIYSKNLKLVKETKINDFISPIFQVGNFYVAKKIDFNKSQLTVSVWIYSDSLMPKTLIYKPQPRPHSNLDSPINLVKPRMKFTCTKDRIYLLPETYDFRIEVYDTMGRQVSLIQREFKPTRITSEHKKRLKEGYLSIPAVRKYLEWNKKKKYFFPEYFPAIKDFCISDNTLYVKTFSTKEGKEEYLLLDLDGNYKNTVYLPEAARNLYSIKNRTFFFIEENIEEEEWELRVVTIN